MMSASDDLRGRGVLDRWDAVLAVVLGVASFSMYTRTLLPGLLPGDSAEFQTLAYTLDHAHTTGYHVYLVLAKLFTFLPVGDIAYRVNLFSAFMGGLAVALVYLAGRVLSGSRWGGLLGAAALAVAATFWAQAIIAEVYTAGSAFSAGILLLVLLWQRTRQPAHLVLAGVLGGMGFGVHGSVILLAPPIVLLALLHPRELRRIWKPALGGALLGLGLLLAAFVLVDFRPSNVSMVNTYVSSISRWDLRPDQIDSFWERFAFLIFAQQWRSAMFVDPGNVIPDNFDTLKTFFAQDFSLAARLLGLAGLVALLARSWRLGLFFLSAFITHAIYTLNYRIGDIHVFLLSFYVLFAVLVAEGTGLLLGYLRRLPGGWPRLVQPVLGLGLILLVLAPYLSSRVAFLQAGQARWDFMGLPSTDELDDWHGILRINTAALPQDAVVLVRWHDLYGYAYAAQVEENRPDLIFLEAYPYAAKEGMADSLLDYLKTHQAEGRPVIAVERWDELQRGGFRLSEVPVGVTRMFQVDLAQ